MVTGVTQLLQGRFRTNDGPTVLLKIDTEGDETRCAGSIVPGFHNPNGESTAPASKTAWSLQ